MWPVAARTGGMQIRDPDLPNRSCNVLLTDASEEPAASETSVHTYQTIRRHILEDNGHRHLRENRKSHTANSLFLQLQNSLVYSLKVH